MNAKKLKAAELTKAQRNAANKAADSFNKAATQAAEAGESAWSVIRELAQEVEPAVFKGLAAQGALRLKEAHKVKSIKDVPQGRSWVTMTSTALAHLVKVGPIPADAGLTAVQKAAYPKPEGKGAGKGKAGDKDGTAESMAKTADTLPIGIGRALSDAIKQAVALHQKARNGDKGAEAALDRLADRLLAAIPEPVEAEVPAKRTLRVPRNKEAARQQVGTA